MSDERTGKDASRKQKRLSSVTWDNCMNNKENKASVVITASLALARCFWSQLTRVSGLKRLLRRSVAVPFWLSTTFFPKLRTTHVAPMTTYRRSADELRNINSTNGPSR